jgi:hypothetical protein
MHAAEAAEIVATGTETPWKPEYNLAQCKQRLLCPLHPPRVCGIGIAAHVLTNELEAREQFFQESCDRDSSSGQTALILEVFQCFRPFCIFRCFHISPITRQSLFRQDRPSLLRQTRCYHLEHHAIRLPEVCNSQEAHPLVS